MQGKRRVALRATAFAAEMERLRPFQPHSEIASAVSEHWYEQILQGSITARQGRRIPAQILTAKKRLLNHLRETEEDSQIDEEVVADRYVNLFKSTNILALTDVIIGMHHFHLICNLHVKFGVDQIELFLKNFPKAEVLNRFEKLERWMGKYHKTNHDGTILTPPLFDFLSKGSDFDTLLWLNLTGTERIHGTGNSI